MVKSKAVTAAPNQMSASELLHRDNLKIRRTDCDYQQRDEIYHLHDRFCTWVRRGPVPRL
jgi:hypothetical protein